MTVALALHLALAAIAITPRPVLLPGSGRPVGFDDLWYVPELHAVLAPAGETGRVDLVDPRTGAVSSIEGLDVPRAPARWHGEGTTSADAGRGYVFASDRSSRELVTIDPRARRIVARTALDGGPDYVRWVAPTQEVWVTEPGRREIEILRLEGDAPARVTRAGAIELPVAPESLVVDASRQRAYTNSFHGETFAIDLRTRAVAARWRNRCDGARGIALDAARGLLFVGCEEGKAVSLDVAGGGAVTGEAGTGRGVDSIAYSARLGHLYVPAARSATLTVLGVSRSGALSPLGTVPTAPGAHCAAADEAGAVYVCDPGRGQLLVFHDPYPVSR